MDREVRERLLEQVRQAAANVVREIDATCLERLDSVQVVPSKSPEHGDFASNAAMVLGKALDKPPREIAQRLPPGSIETTR